MPKQNSRSEILNHARQLLYTRGFNAFSHRDLANLVGMKSSSVHYHFPTKQDIGIALILEYRDELVEFFTTVESLSALERLDRFCGLFVTSAEEGGWCLAGMLASDFESLEAPLRQELRSFFELAEDWLAKQALLLSPMLSLQEASARGKCGMSILEGALLLSRAQEDPQITKKTVQLLPTLLSMK